MSNVASSHLSKTGEDTRVGCLIGNHVCCQIYTFGPLPILQQPPRLMTSQPLSMLFQTYELCLDSKASMVVQSGKNRDLNTF